MDEKILALLSAFCFGLNPIVLKLGLRKDSRSSSAVFLGLLSGLLVLLAVAPALGGFQLDRLEWLPFLYFVLAGIFGVFLGRTFLYSSIHRIGSARASAFKNAAPLYTTILALMLLHEFVSGRRWLAIAQITCGLILLGRGAQRQTGRITPAGLLIANLASVFYGIRPIFSKLGLQLAPLPLAATLIGYLTGILLYLCYFLVKRLPLPFRTAPLPLLFFAGGGLLQSLGLLMLNYALEMGNVTLVYPISASAPLFTFILSYSFLQKVEQLTGWDLLGTVMVVIGVIVLF